MVQLPIMFLSYSCKIVYSFASISIFSITIKNLESKDNVNDVVRWVAINLNNIRSWRNVWMWREEKKRVFEASFVFVSSKNIPFNVCWKITNALNNRTSQFKGEKTIEFAHLFKSIFGTPTWYRFVK